MKDHEELHATLVQVRRKYKDEDCVFMRNPTMSGAKGNLEGLKRRAVKKAWTLEETHRASGTKARRTACCSSTKTHVLHHARAAERGLACASDRLDHLSAARGHQEDDHHRQELPQDHQQGQRGKEKVVFLDIAHGEKPKGGAFSTMQVYPPTDIYARGRHQCDARVIGVQAAPTCLRSAAASATTSRAPRSAADRLAAPPFFDIAEHKQAAKANKRG